MSILIIPNTFKGSLTNVEVGTILEEEIKKAHPELKIDMFPFSDGGNNMLESIRSLYPDCETITCDIHGPDKGQVVEAPFLIHGGVAYIESAKACGILLSKVKDPFLASSYGLGELILKALDYPINEIRIGLGGSATNDGGTGMLKALGVRFFSENHKSFLPLGRNLGQISYIDIHNLDKRLSKIKITILSDVINPLLGKNGASYVFAFQKGCERNNVWKLEKGMKSYALKCQNLFHKDYSIKEGAGAAGGIGFALLLFLNANIVSGADFFLNSPSIKSAIEHCSTIITGEGHLDAQTFDGKGISKIMDVTKGKNIIVIAGKTDKGITEVAVKNGASYIYSLNNHIRGKSDSEKKRIATRSLRDTIHIIMSEHASLFLD